MNQAHTRSSSFDVPLKCGRLASTRATKGAHPDARRAALAERVFLVTIAKSCKAAANHIEIWLRIGDLLQTIGILTKRRWVRTVIVEPLALRCGDLRHLTV